MPFTYLSHQAPAVALKLAAPSRLDGTALVIGTMAPDWSYALHGSRWYVDAHLWPWVILFCVPVTVAAAAVLRLVAPSLFARAAAIWAPLSQLRLLAARRPPLVVTTLSAALGAGSHAGWDAFTHNYRWGGQHIALLRDELIVLAGRSLTGAQTLQHISTVLGAAITVVLLVRILRLDLLQRWYGTAAGPVPTGLRRATLFWTIAACGPAAGVLWALDATWSLPVLLTRVAVATGAGLVAAALLAPPGADTRPGATASD